MIRNARWESDNIKTGITSPALLELDIPEHDVFPFHRYFLLEDLPDAFRRMVSISFPGTAHNDKNLHTN